MINHYLLSIPLASPPNSHLHSYLMCKDESLVERAIDKMFDECEKNGCRVLMPAAMATKLSSGTKLPSCTKFVRSVIAETPEAKDNLATAKDFHMSLLIVGNEDPRSERLLKLH
jgi:hypothetical protein